MDARSSTAFWGYKTFFAKRVRYEEKFKTLEKERPNALEMATQAHAKGKEEACFEVNIKYFSILFIFMITSPGRYVDVDFLNRHGFNYDEATTVLNVGEYQCRVFLTEPTENHESRETHQLLLVAGVKKRSVDWFFRKIPDISQKDGLGIKEEEFLQHLKATISQEHQINPKNLREILERS